MYFQTNLSCYGTTCNHFLRHYFKRLKNLKPIEQPNLLINKIDNYSITSLYYRYLRAEELRHQREMEFQLKQARLENERRRSEREHEMNVLKLLLSSNHERPSTGRGFAPNDNACFGQFYSGMPMYQPSVPMHSSMDNISVSDSDGSSFTTL